MIAMPEIGTQCRNRWRSILPMFDIGGAFLSGKQGPCPICDGKTRFRFDDKEGRGTFYCNQCGAGDGVKLIMLKTGQRFPDAIAAIRERLGEASEICQPKTRDNAATIRAARALWESARPIGEDEAARYLISRGIPGPWPQALRFCPFARVMDHPSKSSLTALLALVTRPDGKPANVHRTYLEDGRKALMQAPRKMMAGLVPEGSAIRLMPHSGVLGVAEGIETALRAAMRFSIPCWSLIDAGKLKRFVIPSDVSELHIFGDNDLNFVGQAAAYELGRRASTMRGGPGRVMVSIPPRAGSDWADDQ